MSKTDQCNNTTKANSLAFAPSRPHKAQTTSDFSKEKLANHPKILEIQLNAHKIPTPKQPLKIKKRN